MWEASDRSRASESLGHGHTAARAPSTVVLTVKGSRHPLASALGLPGSALRPAVTGPDLSRAWVLNSVCYPLARRCGFISLSFSFSICKKGVCVGFLIFTAASYLQKTLGLHSGNRSALGKLTLELKKK